MRRVVFGTHVAQRRASARGEFLASVAAGDQDETSQVDHPHGRGLRHKAPVLGPIDGVVEELGIAGGAQLVEADEVEKLMSRPVPYPQPIKPSPSGVPPTGNVVPDPIFFASPARYPIRMQEAHILAVVPIRLPASLILFFVLAGLILIAEPLLSRRRSKSKRIDISPRGFPVDLCSFQTHSLEFSVEICPGLLKKGELAFLPALELAIENQFRLAMKVRLGDLITVRGPDVARTNTMHVDFVLCTFDDVKPQLVIELDGKSHADQQERDAFVDLCLSRAALPILRVPCQAAYDVTELKANIQSRIKRFPG